MFDFTPATDLDLIADNSLIVHAAVPVGLAATDASGLLVEPLLEAEVGADVLQLFAKTPAAAKRLSAEMKATGNLALAVALIIDQHVRAGRMNFNDLLVRFSYVGPDGFFTDKLILAPTATTAAAIMLGYATNFGEASPIAEGE